MAPRANWKGFLKVAELSCSVALYSAVSASERISFHLISRENGRRVHREFVDEESGEPVESEDQVKGYVVGDKEYVALEPEEIAAAIPGSDKTLSAEVFLRCDEIEHVYLDRPYYLAPGNPAAESAFAVIRDGLRAKSVAALARTVLFRRMRSILIRAYGRGLLATTLRFDYEIRPSGDVFADIPEMKINGEMLDLAKHIVETKRGAFDPHAVHDRYESALAEVIREKMEGKPLGRRARPRLGKGVDLMDALRRSAAKGGRAKKARQSEVGARDEKGGGAERPARRRSGSVQREDAAVKQKTPRSKIAKASAPGRKAG
ncbi:Ku protein [Methylocapsa acidiphila]|uniref:non-homologous end joining protein Ku n=1 Tax=Methylocapsa acidiphila TaxID=133552 RepID=UPI0004258884|nr:Ku protein [Methylocapsa acidiphila]